MVSNEMGISVIYESTVPCEEMLQILFESMIRFPDIASYHVYKFTYILNRGRKFSNKTKIVLFVLTSKHNLSQHTKSLL